MTEPLNTSAAIPRFIPDMNADAKLIELGRRFAEAKAVVEPLDLERMKLHREYERLAEAAGLKDEPEYNKARSRIMKTCGYRVAADAHSKAIAEACRLMKLIHRTPASTFRGFAVKLDAVVFDQFDFRVHPNPGDVAERQLLAVSSAMTKAAEAGGRK